MDSQQNPARAAAALMKEPKFRLLAASCAGLLLLWFFADSVWVAMPAWLVLTVALYRRARTDDWLVLPLAGLPFWWATGLAQYATPVLGGIGVLGALLADPIRGRIRETWDSLGAEKWFALAAFGSMLPSVFVVSGAGRMFTYTRTVGLLGISLIAMLLARAYTRRDEPHHLLQFIVAFAGTLGLWTLAQLTYKGSIHLPLQETSRVLEWLPGSAGKLAARAVAEAAGIKYENIGAGRLVVRPNAFFIHAVVTGAAAGLLGPLIWRRIRHVPVWRAIFAAAFAWLIGTALVASLARGAYLGVAGAVPAAIVVFFPLIRKIDWKRVAPALLIGGLVAVAVIATRGQEAKARNESKLAEGSFVSRAAYYRATWSKTFEYPLFGHGTQRDNVAPDIVAPPGTKITTLPDGTLEATFTNGDKGTIRARRFRNGVMHRTYFDLQGAEVANLISSPDRDPPLGSHSTVLGISYKYGLIGLGAFTALWLFIGLAPLRRLRHESQPMFDDARALWIGILAFGLQFPIYEYDFDSASPYLFYLLCGVLLGLASRSAPSDEQPATAPQPETATAST